MDIRKIGYWISTTLVALVFLGGGVMDLVRPPQVLENTAALGYPAYFALILGAWKVLGAFAILIPKFPRLKEWAYAGIFFDLSGAALSHAFVGDAAPKIIVPLVILALALVSWRLRPISRVLGALSEGGAPQNKEIATAAATA